MPGHILPVAAVPIDAVPGRIVPTGYFNRLKKTAPFHKDILKASGNTG